MSNIIKILDQNIQATHEPMFGYRRYSSLNSPQKMRLVWPYKNIFPSYQTDFSPPRH